MEARNIFLVILLFGSLNIYSLVHGKQPHRKVLILGAGLSGIVAGKTLKDNGIDDFLILEGQDYIGGRIKQVPFSGHFVESGANWIHSVKNTVTAPIWKLKEAKNLKGFYSNFDNIIIRDENGAELKDDASWLKLGKAFRGVEAMQEEREKDNKSPISARDGLAQLGWNPKTPLQYVIDYFTIDFENAKRAELVPFSSLDGWSDEKAFEYFSTDQRGLFSIYESIKKSVQSNTKLNTTVTAIKYNSSFVEVTTKNGETYTADYALCTFSTGVLASDMVKFSPPLPKKKKDAILKMPMSVYTKIFLKFPKKFWDDEEYILLAAKKRGHFPVFQNLDSSKTFPGSGMLLITVTGDEGRRIENQTFEATKKEIVEMLRGVYGQNISEPTDIYYARWSQNQFTRGSYCDATIGFSETTISNLGEKLGSLYFSGAATKWDWYGNMQGAFWTGAEKGTAIANAIKCKENGVRCAGSSMKFDSRFYVLLVLVLIWMIVI